MTDILMPRLSDTMEEGVISAWRKQVGDDVHKGDILVEIETDKAVMEHEAYEDGVLGEILVGEGETAAIGAPIARLAAVGADVSDAPAAQPSASVETSTEEPEKESGSAEAVTSRPAAEAEPAAVPSPPRGNGRVLSSPLARRDAREHGLDLATITGSGPGGRIIRADVQRVLAELPAAVEAPAPTTPSTQPAAVEVPISDTDEQIALTPVRKTIARRLTESKVSAPHIYLTKTVDADALMTLRAGLNERLVAAGRSKVSVNDIIIRASAVVLRDHPVVNSSFTPDAVIQHGRIHVGMAVATEAGLMVPVIRDADSKSVTQIATDSRALAGKARDRSITIDEMSGGTFTVSNLGMFGIEHFTAVINPPESAILAVGAVRSEAGVRDGEVAVMQKMTMTLSADHRVIDGAAAAEFVRDLAALLEDPWLAIA